MLSQQLKENYTQDNKIWSFGKGEVIFAIIVTFY